ncbi:tyrosine-protein phosphatase [Ancylobacter sp.]|uniref:tyrosine-protein phosphatase n=1 Tax=Ancylobacter sp. TaxID=1872567 RepID=UPI003D11C0A4
MRWSLGACGALLLLAGSYAGWAYATGNVHTVVEGELYRSATLSPGRLKDVIDSRGIRTIINLRGRAENSGWYRDEVRIAGEAKVQLIDLRWSARRELTDEEVATFFKALENAPRPILIHCLSGADRTGLAAALYLAGIKKASEMSAELQLSPLFGHIGLPFAPFYAMDETFERLEPWLGYTGS